jgi:hypothetical protein
VLRGGMHLSTVIPSEALDRTVQGGARNLALPVQGVLRSGMHLFAVIPSEALDRMVQGGARNLPLPVQGMLRGDISRAV